MAFQGCDHARVAFHPAAVYPRYEFDEGLPNILRPDAHELGQERGPGGEWLLQVHMQAVRPIRFDMRQSVEYRPAGCLVGGVDGVFNAVFHIV